MSRKAAANAALEQLTTVERIAATVRFAEALDLQAMLLVTSYGQLAFVGMSENGWAVSDTIRQALVSAGLLPATPDAVGGLIVRRDGDA